MEFPLLIGTIIQVIIAIAVINLYILLCKYLNFQLKKNKNAIIIKDSESLFINNDSNGLLINSNLIKSIYINEKDILVELITNDTYKIMKCRDEEEAQISLKKIQENINKISN